MTKLDEMGRKHLRILLAECDMVRDETQGHIIRRLARAVPDLLDLVEDLENKQDALKMEVAAKQRGYEDLHAMLPNPIAGQAGFDIWTKVDILKNHAARLEAEVQRLRPEGLMEAETRQEWLMHRKTEAIAVLDRENEKLRKVVHMIADYGYPSHEGERGGLVEVVDEWVDAAREAIGYKPEDDGL